MPTDDQQILVTGSAPAPAHLTISGAGQVRPKVLRAVYDGTGAGSAFIPVVQIVSDAGVLIGEAKGDQIAAGASAAVSWFPHIKAAAGSTSTSTPAASAYLITEIAKSFVGSKTLAWDHFHTTDTTVFGTNATIAFGEPPHNTTGDILLLCMKDGAYVAEATALWDPATVNFFAGIQVNSADFIDDGQPTTEEDLASTVGAMTRSGQLMTRSTVNFTITAGDAPGGISFFAEGQGAGTTYTVDSYHLICHWLGSGIGSDTTVY